MTNITKLECQKKSNLLELAERIESGKKVFADDLYLAIKLVHFDLLGVPSTCFIDVLDGSLDAANALHDAVLPGCEWNVYLDEGVYGVNIYTPQGDGETFSLECGQAPNPAAAWVAAILRAKAGVD